MATTFGGRTVRELLSAPRSMGVRTATRLAEHWDLDPEAEVATLGSAEITRLREGLADASYGLPEGVADGRRAPPPPHDGRGASGTILGTWVDSVGAPADTPRAAAAAAASREGWPQDAVPTAQLLLEFTETRLAPVMFPEWDRISASEDADERTASLRAQATDWRRLDDREAFFLGCLLDLLLEAMTSVRKAQRLANLPESEWGSATPLAAARNAARRCGELLGCCEIDAAVPLLDQLPAVVTAPRDKVKPESRVTRSLR
jgi:hypothetical protein